MGNVQKTGSSPVQSDTYMILWQFMFNVVFKKEKGHFWSKFHPYFWSKFPAHLLSLPWLQFVAAENNLLGKILQKRLTLSQALISVMFHTSTVPVWTKTKLRVECNMWRRVESDLGGKKVRWGLGINQHSCPNTTLLLCPLQYHICCSILQDISGEIYLLYT